MKGEKIFNFKIKILFGSKHAVLKNGVCKVKNKSDLSIKTN